jgi:uncharacterized protein (DUF2147 family)
MRLLASLILLISTVALAALPINVLGDWKTPSDSIVRIAPCAASAGQNGSSNICLTVVKLSPTSPETTDQKNPDAALRRRAICGLTVGTSFHQTDPDHLTDGHLYDPQTGRTYQGTITRESTAAGDTLHLRGYIGISLFGRSETWQRVPTITPCK